MLALFHQFYQFLLLKRLHYVLKFRLSNWLRFHFASLSQYYQTRVYTLYTHCIEINKPCIQISRQCLKKEKVAVTRTSKNKITVTNYRHGILERNLGKQCWVQCSITTALKNMVISSPSMSTIILKSNSRFNDCSQYFWQRTRPCIGFCRCSIYFLAR